jgi:CubicO group peptidase (beta-lactamase class C family)
LWFSVTKIATATAAMRLHADGLLDLEAPIGAYLPGYRPHPRHGHPTTRQLLSHTAGLGNPLPVRWVRPEHHAADPNRLARIVRKHGTPQTTVGSRAAYSNIGYLLAGEVMEAATGRPVEECVQELVLNPLGMTGTGYGYNSAAPRAVGYVRMARAVRPVLVRILPKGVVGPQVGRYTSLNPFLVNGAAYGGLVGTAGTLPGWPGLPWPTQLPPGMSIASLPGSRVCPGHEQFQFVQLEPAGGRTGQVTVPCLDELPEVACQEQSFDKAAYQSEGSLELDPVHHCGSGRIFPEFVHVPEPPKRSPNLFIDKIIG